MKKLLTIILSLLLIGCTKQTGEYLEMGQLYTIDEHMTFEIIKSEVTKTITPTNKNQTYQSIQASNNNTFVDTIIEIKNIQDEEFSINDFIGAYTIEEVDYDISYLLEDTSYQQLSSTDTIKSQEERYVHLYSEIPENKIQNDATAFLTFFNQDYVYTFSTEETKENHEVKSIGDTLQLEKSDIKLQSSLVSDKIEPSEKGIFYSYIPVDNKDNIYHILHITLNNKGQDSIQPHTYLYLEYVLDNEVYQSTIVVESENKKNLSDSDTVEPSQTKTIYVAFEVSKESKDQKGVFKLFVEGDTYDITEQ